MPMTAGPAIATTLDFDPKHNTALLHLHEYPLADALIEAAAGEGYEPKREFHVTVLGFGTTKKLLATLPEGERVDALASVCAALDALDWSVAPTGRLVRINKSEDGVRHDDPNQRSTIIELVACPAMGEFYERLREIFPAATIATPPPHITLLTRHDPMGIALRSAGDVIAFGAPYDLRPAVERGVER